MSRDTDKEIPQYWEENSPKCHCVHHKHHNYCPMFEIASELLMGAEIDGGRNLWGQKFLSVLLCFEI